MEREGVQSLDISYGSSESLSSYGDQSSLLASPSRSPDYKSVSKVQRSSSPGQDVKDDGEGPGGGERGGERVGQVNLLIYSSNESVAAIISLLLVGVFISNADGTLVTATYATITSELGALNDAAWLATSFTLAFCAAQPIAGKLSDIYGRKKVLLASYGTFALGSVVTGIAQSMLQIIAGRVISGLGAAGMVITVSVLITDLVPLIQVAGWRSYVNVVASLGRSIGGPLGGFLADTIGWRWSFIGQGPLILLAIILVSIKLPSHSSRELPQPKGHPSKLRRIDFVGAILLTCTIVSFLSALSLGGQTLPWSHPLVYRLLTGSVLLGCVFALWEIKWAFEPIFPPALLIRRNIVTPYAILALQTSAQLSMMFSVPLYFRVTANASNTIAGAHLFPAVFGNIVGSILAGFTIRRTGKYKVLTILAMLSSSITYFLLIIRWHGHISLLESLEIIPGGFGSGVAASTVFIALTSSVSHAEIAVTAAGMYLSSSTGMLAGLAVSSSVQSASLRVLLIENLAGFDNKDEIIEKVVSSISAIFSLEESAKRIVIDSYVKSLEYSHCMSPWSKL